MIRRVDAGLCLTARQFTLHGREGGAASAPYKHSKVHQHTLIHTQSLSGFLLPVYMENHSLYTYSDFTVEKGGNMRQGG